MFLGYVEFIALLFLPGLAFMELFQFGAGFTFAERLGLAFGLSMAIDVIVLAFRTSGLLIGTQRLVGIFPHTLELMLASSFVAFVVPIAARRRVTFWMKPTRQDLVVLGLVLAQALLVMAHFYKYPIFPEFQSADFTQHVQITSDLQAGRATLLPGGILYYGAHLLMGSLLALSGDLALAVTQYAMGILVVFSPLLVFIAVASLSKSRNVGVIATLLYVATGFVWFGSVFNAGLYANFYGILAILFLFSLIPLILAKPRSPEVWLAFLIATLNGYFSHYSFVTILPALLALPIAIFIIERKVKLASVGVAAFVLVPALGALAAEPRLLGLLIQFVQATGGGNVNNDTSVSHLLVGWPVLRYIFDEITDDAASGVTLALALLGSYFAIRTKNPYMWMMIVWLVAILVVAPVSPAAWRFSYMALLPLLILASLGFERLIPAFPRRAVTQRSKLRARRTDSSRYRQGGLVIALLLMVVGSWSWNLVADASSNGAANNSIQQAILNSMRWMNSTLPAGSQVVSVTDSDYRYYQLLYDKPAGYGPLASPDEIAASINGSTVPTYVVLTSVGSVAVANQSENPFTLYAADSRFNLIYNNTGVIIYKFGK